MIHDIKVKKGLDIPLGGDAERIVVDMRGEQRCAVKPTDVVGFTPRLAVAEGDTVTAGQPLITDKRDPRLFLPAPISGVVQAIVRGEKRRLLEVVVRHQATPADHNTANTPANRITPEAPVWWMLRERPFGTIANPDHTPKGIFVSMLDTNPLAPDMEFALRGREHDFEAGLQALAAMAPLHLTLPSGSKQHFHAANLTVHTIEGPHPAGNVGTQIAAISPINKGECVWTVGAQDVATIGHWVLTGQYRPERTVTVAGPAAKAPKYYRLTVGCSLRNIADVQVANPDYPSLDSRTTTPTTRIISGSILSGTQVSPDGFLGMYDQQVTLVAEGDQYEFMGWLMPGLKKFSFSKTFLSGILSPLESLNSFKAVKKMASLESLTPSYDFNTNLHGSVRPFLFSGQFEQVFPFDIYPQHLIKACIIGDIELQEQLGIYEVEPEDFALCEYIDPSKTEIQTTIREALEVLRKEATA